MPVPETSEDWAFGRDARIKQLPGPPQEVLERRARAEQLRQHQMGKADVRSSLPSFPPPRLFTVDAFTRLMPLFPFSHVRVCSTRSWRWSLAGCSSWRCWCSASRAVRSGSSRCARTPRGVCVPFSLSLLLLLSVAFVWRPARLNLICDDVAQAKLLESASASASEAAAATIKSEL